MGSFKFFGKYLFYRGALYRVEGYDMDYSGDCWESEQIAGGFPSYDVPLIIPRKVPIEEIEAVLINAETFKDTVMAFTEKKIAVCVDSSVAHCCSLKDEYDEYEKDLETSERVKLICRLLGIKKEHKNFLNRQKIIVVCPEFILLDGKEKYNVIFFDDIQDILLSLSERIPLVIFKSGLQMKAEIVSEPDFPYTAILYY